MLFFLMRRPPPISTRTYTLFPYTTLILSLPSELAYAQDATMSSIFGDVVTTVLNKSLDAQGEAGPEFLIAVLTGSTSLRDEDVKRIAKADRKSTRLNSSH